MTRMFALECLAKATLALIHHEPENALDWIGKAFNGMTKIKETYGFNSNKWA